MNLAAKISVLLSLGLIYVLIIYIAKMNFNRIHEIQLYMDNGQCFFYSTDQYITYEKNQKVSININGEIYDSVSIINIDSTDLVVDGNQVVRYQLNQNMCQYEMSGSPCTIYTEYSSFMEFIIDRLKSNS